jgi:hypothetical protein
MYRWRRHSRCVLRPASGQAPERKPLSVVAVFHGRRSPRVVGKVDRLRCACAIVITIPGDVPARGLKFHQIAEGVDTVAKMKGRVRK